MSESAEDWWSTAIIAMKPGEIRLRGHAIEDLIGRVTYPEMVWLMTRGDLPSTGQAKLLEAALVAGVDHGPQAPSIAIARMAMTCGVGINSAMASAVNVLGDVHGGAGEQCMALLDEVIASGDAAATVARWQAEVTKYLPGFGHRFHPVDPRGPALLALVDQARAAGVVEGAHAAAARAIEAVLADKRKGKPVPLNIDGATAVIYGELGFPAVLARGLFVLSRSVGILAHAYEQGLQGGRNKGPIPRHLTWTYTGAPPRTIER